MQSVKQMIRSFTKQRKQRRRAYAAFTTLAILVSITTMYTLSQPAATLAAEPVCGLEEHVHTADCYTRQLVCGIEELPPEEAEAHVHDDSCYEQMEKLVCGQEESPAHTHDDSCLGLVCGQDEYEAHTHDGSCYITVEEYGCGQEEYEGHEHSDACYTTYRELVCGQDECEGHWHDDSCYDENGELICGEDEYEGHQHDDSCYEETAELTCGEQEGPGHTHDESCLVSRTELTCGAQEGPGHVHDDSCYGYICGQEETEGHQHTEDCYESEEVLVCTVGHVHSDACYAEELTCGKTEHTHSSNCYAETGSSGSSGSARTEDEALNEAFPEELPEGYRAYEFENEDGLYVLAYAPEDAFKTEVVLFAQQLAEGSDGYAEAEEELEKEEDLEYDGFVALDIRFVNPNAADPTAEVEPDSNAGRVYVKIEAKALLPDTADESSLAVQHHKEEKRTILGFIPVGKELVMETVADQNKETGKITVAPIKPEKPPKEEIKEKPIIEIPVKEPPVKEPPVKEEPVIKEEPIKEPVEEPKEPAPEVPVVEEPKEPVPEEPVVEEPKEPVPEEPVVEEPKEPAPEEPVVEEPKEPAPEEPVVEEPKEPAPKEPVVEEPKEPAPEEPVVEEPKEPVPEEPVVEEPKEPVSEGSAAEGSDEEPASEGSAAAEPSEEPATEESGEEPDAGDPADEEPDDQSDGMVDVTAEFTVDSFSTFTITYAVNALADGTNNLIWTNGGTTYRFADKARLHVVDESGNEIGAYVDLEQNVSEEIAFQTVVEDLLTAKGLEPSEYVVEDFYLVRNGQTVTFESRKYGNWYIWNRQFGMKCLFDKYGDANQYIQDGDEYYIVLKGIQTIEGVDTSKLLNISLFNYDTGTVNNGHKLRFYNQTAGTTADTNDYNEWTGNVTGINNGNKPYTGIVQDTKTKGGYPTLAVGNKESLGYLFGAGGNGVTSYTGLNKLFQLDGKGYYYYDSSQNFATLVTKTQGAASNQNFTLYNAPNNIYNSDTADHYVRFLPFNQYSAGLEEVVYNFGMTIDFEFVMPKDGQITSDSSGTEDMIFEFSGDDDVWVFIDNTLVLDLGGIHNAIKGTINFNSGEVIVGNDTAGYSTVGRLWGSDGILGEKFADYSSGHEFNFYYLERGGGASNCAIKFNLPAIPKNSLLVGKQLETDQTKEYPEGITDYIKDSLSYMFRVLAADSDGNATEMPFFAEGTKYTIQKNGVDTGRTGTVAADGSFTLKADEVAVFAAAVSAEKGSYVVQEIMPDNNTGQYSGVGYTVDGAGGTSDITGDDGDSSDTFTSYTSGKLDAESKSTTVMFTNKVDVSALSLLRVTKVIRPGSNISPNTEFSIIIKLDGEKLAAGTGYVITGVDGQKTNKTVGADGIIKLKANETISLAQGILLGTEFEVYEADASGYTVVYTGTVTYPDDENSDFGAIVDEYIWNEDGTDFEFTDSISGIVEHANSEINILVANADYDFGVEFPVEKTLVGADEDESHTFSFTVEQVAADGSSFDPETMLPGFQVDTTGDYGEVIAGIGYKNTDPDGSYYYKVSETVGSQQIAYDPNYYIITVTVETDTATGRKTAEITNVVKYTSNGEIDTGYAFVTGNVEYDVYTFNPLTFQNAKSGSLVITKTVERTDGATPSTAIPYRFRVELPDTLIQEVSVTYTNTSEIEVPHEDGTLDVLTDTSSGVKYVEIELYHSETATISGLPIGNVTVSESDTSGYSVKWQIDEKDATYGISTTFMIGTDHTVACINTTGAALPSTGGVGTHIFTLLGMTMMLGAGVLLMLQRRRREGPDAG